MKTKEKYIIFREDKGIYQVCVKIKDARGKVHARTATTKTMEEAKKKRDLLLSDKVLTQKIPPQGKVALIKNLTTPNILIKDIMPNWWTLKMAGKTIGTREQAYYKVHKYFIPYWGWREVNDVSVEQVQKWIDDLQEHKKLSHKTVSLMVGYLRSFFAYAVETGASTSNPCNLVHVKRGSEVKSRRSMTKEEWDAIQKYAKTHNYIMYVIFRLLYETDSRCGEILALRWQDIDFTNKKIRIGNTIARDKGAAVFQEYNKTHTIKVLPLSEQMHKALMILQVKERLYKAKKHQDLEGTDFVFVPRSFHSSQPFFNPSSVSGAFRRYRDILKLDKSLCLHCIRHTATTNLIKAGVPIEKVQAIGGWKKVSTLLDIYTHVQNDELAASLEKTLFDK